MFLISAVSPIVIGYKFTTTVGEEKIEIDKDKLLDYLTFSCYSVNGLDTAKYEYYKGTLFQEYPGEIDEIEYKLKPVESSPTPIISSPPMDSPWPMLGHNIRHTGRSPYSTENVTGLEKWRHCNYRHGWGGLDGGPVIDNDGIIYYGDMDRYFYAIYPNGTRKWKTYLNSPIRMTPAIDENGILYIGTIWEYPANYFYSIDSKDGSIKWKYRIGGNIDSCPAIGGDGTIYFGDWDGWINALNPNGTLKWRYKADGAVLSSPAIGKDGTIYCGCHVGVSPPYEGRLYAFYPNGTLRWQYKASHWVRVAPCIGDDGIVYFVSIDGKVHAAYPNNGTLKWKIGIGDGSTYPSIGPDGTLYAGWGKLRAINTENGTIKWSFNPGDSRCIEGGGPITSPDGTIYFGTRIREVAGGEIIALYSNGTEKWRKKLCSEYIDSSLAIGKDGTVYIGSTTKGYGYLHAFGPIESNKPPKAPTIGDKVFGRPNLEYAFYFTGYDPDNNPISIYIDWGDGKFTDWTSEKAPGEKCYYVHTYNRKGNYTIKAKVKDILGEESDFSYYEVEIVRPKFAFLWGKISNYTYFWWDDLRFNAKDLIVIQFNPPSFNRYTSGETIFVKKSGLKCTSKKVFGLFSIYSQYL